jgi:hypothetical protein
MIKGLSIAKFARYPSRGVYYCLPSKDASHWILLHRTERNVDTGEGFTVESELSHAQQYSEVVEYFQQNFNVDISDIGRRCIPRGRIEKGKVDWIIQHGDDTPITMRHQVIAEFGLSGLSNVNWEFDSYESMEIEQRQRLLERCPLLKPLFEKL